MTVGFCFSKGTNGEFVMTVISAPMSNGGNFDGW